MKIFCNREEFAIGLEYYIEKYKDDAYLKENIDELWAGGEVYFWVKGKNLFEFKEPIAGKTYGYYNLYSLVDFLSEYLIYHLYEVPFPIETEAINAIDMIEETALVKNDVENELQAIMEIDYDALDMELREKRDEWIYVRSFLASESGSFLPDLIVCRAGDKIELSWNNHYPHNNGDDDFYMLYTKGVDYVDAKLYRDVIMQFCLEYCNHIQEKKPELAVRYRKNLQRAMEVNL
jgi:hypothetical protein